MKKEGHIEIILGPMFSGKSSEMLRKVRRYEHAKKRCLVINYHNDNRYSYEDVASTHDKLTMKALKIKNLSQVIERSKDYDVIAIDEGQFFSDIVEVSQMLANNGLVVIIAALDGTFQRKPFGNILNLVPLAQTVSKLSAVCIDCGNEAAFTKRTIDNQQIQLIGGSQTYKPVCRKCFNKSESQSSIFENLETQEMQTKTQNKQNMKLQKSLKESK